jgi:hypothetical protein
MILAYDAIGYPAMTANQLWWSNYGDYVIFGIVAVTLTVCFTVLRRKE